MKSIPKTMKNLLFSVSIILLFSISITYNAFAWIPPTNAFDKIIGQNGSLTADNYFQTFSIKGTGKPEPSNT